MNYLQDQGRRVLENKHSTDVSTTNRVSVCVSIAWILKAIHVPISIEF